MLAILVFQVLICEGILDRNRLRTDVENCQPQKVIEEDDADTELHVRIVPAVSQPETVQPRTTTITFGDTTNGNSGERLQVKHNGRRSLEHVKLPDTSDDAESKGLECEKYRTWTGDKRTRKSLLRTRNFQNE
jgi:hypothetical protein